MLLGKAHENWCYQRIMISWHSSGIIKHIMRILVHCRQYVGLFRYPPPSHVYSDTVYGTCTMHSSEYSNILWVSGCFVPDQGLAFTISWPLRKDIETEQRLHCYDSRACLWISSCCILDSLCLSSHTTISSSNNICIHVIVSWVESPPFMHTKALHISNERWET